MPAIGAAKQERGFMTINKLIILALLTGLLACKDNTNNNNGIPDTFVDIYLNTALPQYQQLNVIGGWVYYPGGNRGIFVYHNPSDEIVAFDRNCTYRISDSCATISLDNSEAFLRCGSYSGGGTWVPCCNSKFNFEGFPYEGPAQFPLKKYFVGKNGSVIRVSSSPI